MSYEETAMTTLYPKRTGLTNIVVHVQPRAGAKHACRVKVSNIPNSYDMYVNFSLDLDGKLVAGNPKLSKVALIMVRAWITQNKVAIQNIWDATDLDSIDHAQMLKPLEMFKGVK